jgi:arylsulfatase A-like enzyme
MRHKNAASAAMVHSMDQNVGRVLDRLNELRIAGRTVVVFSSDNGGFINPYNGQAVTDNYPLRSGKGALYEGGIRVPLMIRWPGVAPAGVTCGEPVSSIDFYPTMLEMAGLKGDAKHNATVDGKSLVPLLKSPGARLDRDELFFHYPHYYPTTTPVSAILARDWKLLEYFEDGHLELYNLGDDPSEKRDLAAAMPDRAKELHARLAAWRKSVNAPMPEKNPGFRQKPVGQALWPAKPWIPPEAGESACPTTGR